jgi:hypothetical protein
VRPSAHLDRQTYRRIAAASGDLVECRAVRDYVEGRRKARAATEAVIKTALAKLGIPDPHAEPSEVRP